MTVTVGRRRTGPSALIVAEMTVRSLVRRRLSMAILVALPLLLYIARHDHVGQSIRGLLFGVSWAVTTVAYFAATAAWEAEPRLGLNGWSWRGLLGGRIAGLLALGWVLAALYLVLVLVDQPVGDGTALVADFLVTAAVSVMLGTALGAVFHREMEGALVIFLIAALQSVVNPDTVLAHLIPFWSSREIGTYAIDGPEIAADDPPTVGELRAACALLVAVDADDLPVAYARLELVDGHAHLEQLSVDPASGRQGIGGRLLDAAATWALERGDDQLTLTTFREVAFNAPYYRRRGFEEVPETDRPPGLAALVAAEADHGLDPHQRVTMRRRLGPHEG